MQLCLQHGLTDKRNGLIVFYGCPQHRRKGMHKGGGGRGERKKKKISFRSTENDASKSIRLNLSHVTEVIYIISLPDTVLGGVVESFPG